MKNFWLALFFIAATTSDLFSTSDYVYHEATTANPGCGSANYRSVLVPSAGQSLTVAFKAEYQYYQDQAWVYYTTDGNTPAGAAGVGSGTTQVVSASFACNFNSGGVVDVWTATIPAQSGGTTVKYIVSTRHSGGGDEIFGNGCGNCGSPNNTSNLATVFSYRVAYLVSNADDSGAGSLRQAITDANSNAGNDIIHFNIGGGGAQSIALASQLPTITGGLTIDGTTQPGYTSSPLVAVGADFSSTIFYADFSGSVALTAIDVSKNGTAAGIAFQMQNLSSLSLTNCWAKNRTYGLYIVSTSNITATGNDLTDSGVSGGWAIYLNSCSGANMNISNNTIGGTTTHGLWMYHCSSISVAPSSGQVQVSNFLKNLATPLNVEGGSNISVSGLDLEKTDAVGSHVNFSSVTGLTVTNNIFKNRTYGLYINQCSGTITATGNDLTDSGVSGGWAIFLGSTSGTNMDVSNNTIAGTTTNGLWLYHSSNVSIAPSSAAVEVGNLLKPLTTPLNVEGGSNISVTDLDLEKSGAVGNSITFNSVNGLTVTNNIFRNRTYGLYINQCSGTITATGNDLTDCGVSGGWAIFLGSCNGTNMDVSNNTIAGTTTNGLWLYHSSNVSIAPSSAAVEVGNLLKPLTTPLNVEGGSNISVSGLDLEKSGAVGNAITFNSVNGLTVTNNIFRNRTYGLYINQCSNITATGNDLTDCGVSGGWAIFLGSCNGTNMDVSNNTIAGTTTNGLWLYHSSNVSVAPSNAAVEVGNLLKSLTTPLNVEGGSNISVSGLDLEKTGAVGGSINFSSVSGLTVTNNIFKNRTSGLYFDQCSNITATGNDLTDCGVSGGWAIFLGSCNGTNMDVSNNTIGGTTTNGLWLYHSSNVSVAPSNAAVEVGSLLKTLTTPLQVQGGGNISVSGLDLEKTGAVGGGFNFGSVNGLTVTNNIFRNRTSGMYFDQCSNITATGNDLTDCGVSGGWAIVLASCNSTNMNISGNTIGGATTNGVYIFYTSGVSLGASTGNVQVGTALKNLQTPVQVEGAAGFSADDLDLEKTGAAGSTAITVNNCSGSILMNNLSIGNRSTGISFNSGSASLGLTCSSIAGATNGVDIHAAAEAVISGCNFSANSNRSIRNFSGTSVTAEDNFWLNPNCDPAPAADAVNGYSGTVDVDPHLTAVETCGSTLVYEVEINLQGGDPTPIDIADGETTTAAAAGTAFGMVLVGTPSAHTFIIENTGDAALTISSITSDNSQFVVSGAPGSVAAGSSTTFTLTFTPTATGVQNATITVSNSDCDEVEYDFAVTGNGVVPAAALNFDGVNDYVVTSTSPVLTGGGFTVELWAKRSGSGTYDIAVGQGSGGGGPDNVLHVGFRDNNQFTFALSYDDLDVNASYSDNNWHHWACVYTGAPAGSNNQFVYRDGVLVGSRTTNGAYGGSGPLTIGTVYYALTADAFSGNIDEVRVWNTARTCDQINQLRNCELTGSESGLVAYYKFNQGFAAEDNTTPPVNSLTDATANANNGTLNGFALTGATSNWVTPGGVTTGTSCPAVSAPEIDVQGNSVSISDGDNTPSTGDDTDFGNLNIGSTLARTFTIFNTGNADLTVNSVASDNVKFAVSGAPTMVAAGSSADFTLTFSPTATGVQNATITVNSSDCDEMVYDFAVTGKGAQPGAALHFDGADDFVAIADANNLDLGSNLTLEAWVKPESFSPYNMIIDKREAADASANYGLTLTNGKPMFYFWNGGDLSFHIAPNAIALSTFAHLAATYDGAMVRIYVNGAQVYAQAETDVAPTNNQPLSIGRNPNTLQYFDGDIDEVRVWNTARTCDQISQLRNCEMTGSESGLVAYYKFNQGFAAEDNTTPPVNSLTDATANANNGTLNGFALTGTTSNWITPGGVTTGTSCPAVSAPEVDVRGNSVSISDGDNTPSTGDHTDFDGTFSRTFTIFNTGNADLTVGSITTSNAKFTVGTLTPASPIAQNASASFTLTYNPTGGSTENSNIFISSNDCDEAAYDFQVSAFCPAPTFTACPTNPTASTAAGTCAAAVSYTATSSDAISYSFSGATTGSGTGSGSGESFNRGATTVVLTATNVCSLTTTCQFSVNVSDAENPVITCPATANLNTNNNQCTSTASIGTASATDNCTISQGNSIHFDGGGDYAISSVPGTFLGSDKLTIEFWAKNSSTFSFPIELGSTWQVQFGNGTFYLSGYGLGAFNTGATVNGSGSVWEHFALTFDGAGTWKAFKNGQPTPTPSCTMASCFNNYAPTLTNPQLRMGVGNNNYFYNGNLDEVRIWSVERTQAQIAANLYNEMSGSETGLKAYYKFNQGTAGGNNTGITEAIATAGNNATLSGLTLNGSTSNFVAGQTIVAIVSNDAPASFPKGATVVTWQAADGSGNTHTCQQTVNVSDNQLPAITCPTTVSVNTTSNSCENTATWTTPTPTDNCPGASIQSVSHASGSTFQKGTTAVTYTAVDAAGNTKTCAFNVVVSDNVAPTITCPADLTVGDGGYCFAVLGSYSLASKSDNCSASGSISVSQSPASTTNLSGHDDFEVVTLTATDESSNSSSCTFTVTLKDVFAPTFTCPTTVSLNTDLGSCNYNGLISIFNVADNYCTSIFTVIREFYDENGMLLSAPDGISLTANPATGAAEGTISGSLPKGVNTVSLSVTDPGGNVGTCEIEVTVADDEEPTISNCPTTQNLNVAAGTCAQNFSIPAPTLYDNCLAGPLTWNASFSGNANGNPSNLTNQTAGAASANVSFSKGTTTVTLSATDAAGNVSTSNCSFSVVVADNIAPTITCPADATVSSDASCAGVVGTFSAVSTSDNCTATGSISVSQSNSGDGNLSGHNDFETVTLTANDGNGNTAICSFTVTLKDVTPPGGTAIPISFAAPSNILTNVAEANTYNMVYQLNITNSMSGAIPYSTNNAAALTSVAFDRLAYYMELDGNWVWVSLPALTSNIAQTGLPSNWTFSGIKTNLNIYSNKPGIVTGTGINTGNVEIWPSNYSTGNNVGIPGANGGNYDFGDGGFDTGLGHGSFQIHNYGAGQTLFAINNWRGGTELGIGNQPSGNPDWTFTSNVNSYTTRKLYVFARPSTPTLCLNKNITLDGSGAASIVLADIDNNIADNCGIATKVLSKTSFNCSNLGANTVTLTVTDINGNTNSCTSTVTVSDAQLPAITCPSTVSVNTATGQCSNAATWTTPVPTDNCSVSIQSVSHASGSTFSKGTTVVTYTAVDAANNTKTCAFNVVVTDTEAPSVTCAADVNINTTAGQCIGTTTLTNPTVTDNCPMSGNALDFDGSNDYVSTSLDADADVMPVTTWEAWVYPTDAGSSNWRMALSMEDGGWDRFIAVRNGNWQMGVSSGGWDATTATLNQWQHVAVVYSGSNVKFYKNGIEFTYGGSEGGHLSAGLFTIGANNFYSQNFMGKIDEVRVWNIARTQSQIQASMNSELAGNETGLVAYYKLNQGTADGTNTGINTAIAVVGPTGTLNNFALTGATSNWTTGNVVSGLTNNAPATYPKGATVVTWTATDASGNTATCQQTVNVSDIEKPTTSGCPTDQNLFTQTNSCIQNYSIPAPTISDNCTGTMVWHATFSGNANGNPTNLTNLASGTASGDVVFQRGTTTVTLSSTDASGNVSTSNCSFSVVVSDNVAPVAPTLSTINAVCTSTPSTPTATDNCAGTVTGTTSTTFPITFVGTTTITWTFSDGNGNSTTATQNVVIVCDQDNDGVNPPDDCNDNDNTIYPNAPELCDGKDNDCDGSTDEGLTYVQLTQIVTPAGCATATNGAIDLSVAAGIAPFTFNWAGGATSEDRSNLGIGNYLVTVSSSEGCTATADIAVGSSNTLATTHTVIHVTCFGGANGTIFTTATGGTPPYIYSWSNAKTTANINLLTANTYTLTLTDAVGCTKTNSATVTQPTALNFTLSQTGSGPYAITFSASGGTPNYQYNRTGATTFVSNPVFAGVAAGTYIFKTKDANNCQKSRIAKVPLVGPKPGKGNSVADVFDSKTGEQTILERGFEAKTEAEMLVFPNPTSEYLNLIWNNDEAAVAGRAVIFNSTGQEVFTQNVVVEPGEEARLQIAHLPEGAYFLVFKNEDGTSSSQRFVKSE